nr:IS1478 transposase CDS [Bradyrhizobium sp.]
MGNAMSKPRDDRQKDLLLPALDQIIDMGHPLVRLAALIDWNILNERFSSVCQAGSGQPGLPTRLVAGLFILKHMHNLSDEVLCARWIENPYYQYFCGELSFCHRSSSNSHWRSNGAGIEAASVGGLCSFCREPEFWFMVRRSPPRPRRPLMTESASCSRPLCQAEAMCEKCVQYDDKIARYRRLSLGIND